jgi:hypothetical protein
VRTSFQQFRRGSATDFSRGARQTKRHGESIVIHHHDVELPIVVEVAGRDRKCPREERTRSPGLKLRPGRRSDSGKTKHGENDAQRAMQAKPIQAGDNEPHFLPLLLGTGSPYIAAKLTTTSPRLHLAFPRRPVVNSAQLTRQKSRPGRPFSAPGKPILPWSFDHTCCRYIGTCL